MLNNFENYEGRPQRNISRDIWRIPEAKAYSSHMEFITYGCHVLTGLSDRLAPYERRVIELLRNSKDKRARKLAKKRVCIPIAGFRTTQYFKKKPATDVSYSLVPLAVRRERLTR